MKTTRPLVCFLLLASSSLFAQQISGSIRGTVSDPSGAIVQNATVTVHQVETGLSRTTNTDRNGSYVLLELPVGHYFIESSAAGFQKYVQEGIFLSVNEAAAIPIRLSLGGSERINVQADAELIQPTVTSMGQTVQTREILDLPLNGRDFAQLGTLQPGVVPLTPGLLEAGGSLREQQGYSVNGQRPESNNFLIDGANNVNGVDGGFVLEPPIDAIEEFRILTHNSNAEFGHNLGSTTNIITKSGSNSYHGAAWEFFRNDALDATQFPNTVVEPLKQNQFGASIGGPLRHDKTFFYGFYEGFRYRKGESQISAVPSKPERQGDFSELCKTGFFTSGPETGFCQDVDSKGQPIDTLFNVFLKQPYPFNQMPAPDPTLMNPMAQSAFSVSLLNLIPIPDVGTNGFLSTGTLHDDRNQFGLRVDHYLTSADTLNFRYMFNNVNRLDPLSTAGATIPGYPVGEDHRAQNFVAQETHTFSPSVVGVLRFSYLRNKFLVDEHINHTSLSSLGFTYSPSLAIASGPPFIQVNGYTSVGDPITGPRDSYENAFDYSGAVSWVRGAHEFKFGGGYEHLQVNALQGIATNGFFVFVPFPVTDSFASFLWGSPVVFLQGRGDFGRGIRGNSLNWYAQDTYKVSRRLTLNYGLRYELPFPYTEIHNRQTLWIPGRQSTVMPSARPDCCTRATKAFPRG